MQVAAAAQKVTAAHEGLLVFLLNLPLSLPALGSCWILLGQCANMSGLPSS